MTDIRLPWRKVHTEKVRRKEKKEADADLVRYRGSIGTFFIFAIPNMTEKWRKDKSIPLVEVVESFDVFKTNTQGEPMRPMKGELLSEFETENEEDIARKILEEGEIIPYKPRFLNWD